MNKTFSDYSEAYKLFSEINSSKDVDRKNATIFMDDVMGRVVFIVYWESNK